MRIVEFELLYATLELLLLLAKMPLSMQKQKYIDNNVGNLKNFRGVIESNIRLRYHSLNEQSESFYSNLINII